MKELTSVMAGSPDLAEAQRIVDEAIRDASGMRLRISVAVADEAGGLIAFARMDGASRSSARTAVEKTRSVILTGKPTIELGEYLRGEMAGEPELFHGMITRWEIVPFGGGVPVQISGHLAGAVAVSGGSSRQDHEIAARAASAVFG
jgi:glc operon protein GlcG